MRFRSLAIGLGCGWCLLMAGMSSGSSDGPAFISKLDRLNDTLTTVVDADRTVLVITSETGIGGLALSSKDGRWPKDVTLRLRYHRPGPHRTGPFKTLEGFEMSAGRILVKGSSRQSGRVPFFLAGADGKFPRDDASPAGWLKLEFKSNGDDLDLIVPSNLWHETNEVRVKWIDFYR